jgi:hypothetical protein
MKWATTITPYFGWTVGAAGKPLKIVFRTFLAYVIMRSSQWLKRAAKARNSDYGEPSTRQGLHPGRR